MKLIVNIGTNFHLHLLPHFLKHYTKIGVDHFLCGLHGSRTDEAKAILADYPHTIVVEYGIMSFEEKASHHWKDNFNQYRKEHVKDDEWCLYADVDEFHDYPTGIFDSEFNVIKGKWIERVAKDGILVPFKTTDNPSEVFPYGTREIFCGISEKVMATKGDFEVKFGYHFILKGVANYYPWWLDVHHFRWDSLAAFKYSRRTYTAHYDLSGGKIPDLTGTYKVIPPFPL